MSANAFQRPSRVLLLTDEEVEDLVARASRAGAEHALAEVRDGDALLSEPQAAALLGMSRRGLSKLRQRGEIGFVDARPIRYARKHLREWWARHEVRAR